MTKKLLIFLILAVVAAAAVVAQVTKKPVEQGTIKIGGAIGLTGDIATWGEGELKTIQLVLDEQNRKGGINGKSIELVVEDTQGTFNGTVNAVNKLVHFDKVQVIIGPTWGDSFGGGNPIAEKAKVVMISPSLAIEAAKSDVQYDYLFSTWFPQKGEVDYLQKFAAKNGYKSFVVVHETEPFGVMMTKLFQDLAPTNGITVDNVLEFQSNDSDFGTIVTKLKALKPKTVFFENSSLGVSGAGFFMKKMKDLGVPVQVFSTSYIEDPQIFKYAGYVNGLIFSHAKPALEIEKLKSINGPSVTNAYDATQAVIEVLKRGARTGEEIKNELHKIKIPGVAFKEISFNDVGQVAGGEFEMKQIKNGQFIGL